MLRLTDLAVREDRIIQPNSNPLASLSLGLVDCLGN